MGPAEYIRNDMTCSEEQRLAISDGSTYVPLCDATDSSLYDPCQCDIGNTITLGQCWCVDQEGNQISGQATYVSDALSFEEVRQTVCVEQLQCSSDVPTSTPTSSQIMNAELNGAIKTVDYPYRVVRNMKDSPDS